MTEPTPPMARREVTADPNVIDPAAGAALGLVCPRCQCPDMRVGCTRDISGGVKRYRYCRNCGRGLPTEEVSASELAYLRRLAGQ
ncbi:MAG: hypothetical protein E6Q40_14485 [Cupriavidus sp.]|nr:MAG: hypothetical protein E6Q40_14485 [Cupriavidus sp.]